MMVIHSHERTPGNASQGDPLSAMGSRCQAASFLASDKGIRNHRIAGSHPSTLLTESPPSGGLSAAM